jgi:hypothetical protein
MKRRVLALLAGSLAGLAGCNSTRVDDPSGPGASGVPVKAPALPADHLAPGELLEGTQEAYAIKLPQMVKVDASFSKETDASGPVVLHAMVDYLRARVTGGELREGADSATFEHVTAPGHAEPELSIHLVKFRDVVRIVFTDTTPVVQPALPDDAARFKRAGLTPGGKILDPTHLD